MTFRIVVSGTRRELTDEHKQIIDGILAEAVDSAYPFEPVIVHGACPTGVDAHADAWARREGVTVECYPADWYGPCGPTCRHRPRRPGGKCPAKGPIRNRAMIDDGSDIVVAFPSGVSVGTRGTISYAKDCGARVVVTELN